MSEWKIVEGDCIEQMRQLEEGSVDAVVCDPPYGIGFMGHDWDQPGVVMPAKREGVPSGNGARRRSAPRPGTQGFGAEGSGAKEAGRYDLSRSATHAFQAWCETWAREALRVLKPGGHMLVFGGSRTSHRLTAGIEDAGFEIRDTICWLYGSGFPKSLNLKGDRQGWGTALKPAHEPIVVARKPLAGTVAANVQEHGTGAINVDGCRIGAPGDKRAAGTKRYVPSGMEPGAAGGELQDAPHDGLGRWPANVVLDEEAAAMLDEQTGELTSGANPTRRGSDKFRLAYGEFEGQRECEPARGVDRGGASRFFYCAKASRSERNAGLEEFEERPAGNFEDDAYEWREDGKGNPRSAPIRKANHHPTVKPLALMRWLVRLVTPPGGTVLDPFAGSGTTGCAAALEGFDFIGLEREAEYVAIAEARIAYWSDPDQHERRLAEAERDQREAEALDQGGAVQLGMLDGEAA